MSSLGTSKQPYDIAIIGGGIHGVGVAAEAASRGLKVVLCERYDLGGGASSRSTTLVSGGIQSLARLELDVVKRSFREQATLAQRAPHLMRHLQFDIPINSSLMSKMRLQAGLFIYNKLGTSNKKPEITALNTDINTLKSPFRDCLHYYDCSMNDARLVLINAIAARQYGADIRTYTALLKAERVEQHKSWLLTLSESQHSQNQELQQQSLWAKTLVNCTGKHCNQVLTEVLPSHSRCVAELLRGDHIILPRFYEGAQQGYLLQMPGKQLIYVLPYRQKYTLVGSYEQQWNGKQNDLEADHNAKQFLLNTVNSYFEKQHSDTDIVRHFWSVRSAYDDINNHDNDASYDVALDLECPDNFAPLVNIFGGRLTTYRDAAEKTLQLLKPYCPSENNPGFKNRPLPGGDIDNADLKAFIEEIQFAYPWLPKQQAERYARLYGTLCHQFLNSCHRLSDLGEEITPQLHEKEIIYLIHNEWVHCADDLLWRRTRMGMTMANSEKEKLETYIQKLQH